MNFINYNGQLFSEKEPIFHAGNRALHFGDGIFETIRMIQGRLPFWEDHWKRLQKGIELLHLEAGHLTKDLLAAQIDELAKKNDIGESGRIRLTVFRSGSGKYTPETNKADYLIEAEVLEESQFELNGKGLQVGLFSEVKKDVNQLSGLKTCNALIYVLATVHKKRQGWDDAFILNSQGRICEATGSNVFLVNDEVIYTPPLSEGCVDGVMRKNVIKLSLDNGIGVEEEGMSLEDLEKADELFLTNAIVGIQWIARVKDKSYHNALSKKLSVLLNKILN